MYFSTLPDAIIFNCLSLQAADSDQSVAIWFATERENEDKDLISMIWLRENGWEKSSFSSQPYYSLVRRSNKSHFISACKTGPRGLLLWHIRAVCQHLL